jgi:hypothetical protein
MISSKNSVSNPVVRIWVYIDQNSPSMMRLAALYVLYAVLDKTGGFAKKAGVTKKTMAGGAIRSFIFKGADQKLVLRTLSAYDALVASTDKAQVARYATAGRHVVRV